MDRGEASGGVTGTARIWRRARFRRRTHLVTTTAQKVIAGKSEES
jgi:hypothetical protein